MLTKEELENYDKNSHEYKVALQNMFRINFTDEFDERLSNGGKITNKEISDFCAKFKEYKSENYIRAIIVPMILENYGHVIQ